MPTYICSQLPFRTRRQPAKPVSLCTSRTKKLCERAERRVACHVLVVVCSQRRRRRQRQMRTHEMMICADICLRGHSGKRMATNTRESTAHVCNCRRVGFMMWASVCYSRDVIRRWAQHRTHSLVCALYISGRWPRITFWCAIMSPPSLLLTSSRTANERAYWFVSVLERGAHTCFLCAGCDLPDAMATWIEKETAVSLLCRRCTKKIARALHEFVIETERTLYVSIRYFECGHICMYVLCKYTIYIYLYSLRSFTRNVPYHRVHIIVWAGVLWVAREFPCALVMSRDYFPNCR